MELTTGIKLIKNLEVTCLNDEKAMVDFETGKYFLLKGSANDIWDYIQEETTVEEIVNKEQVITVAQGQKKALPILGALHGGLMKTLITDENTALNVLIQEGKMIE